MHDSQVSASKVITAALWTWVGAVMVAAWIVWLNDLHELAVMFGFTACASSAVAATSSVRCYSLRVCGFLRMIHGLDGQPPSGPRPLP